MLNTLKIKELCESYGIAPAKSRGQNFLIDDSALQKIAEAGELTEKDTVLEVGPGLGVLTDELLKRAGRVVAVELDRNILAYLKVKYVEQKNLELVEGDVLSLNLADYGLKSGEYKVVANLPYNITSYFLRLFLGNIQNKPKEMVLMIQKEVAERIVAHAGEMSVLAVMAQFYAETEIVAEVPKDSFWPSPKVDSTVIKLKLKENLPKIDIKNFFRIVKVGYSAKRKQLHNNLANGLKLPSPEIKEILVAMGYDEKIRAQDLEVEDWVKLEKKLEVLK
jgi:16S rRNA (adenine1518-N6/adenine1519-N6)-dimethyltransferase